MVDFTKKAIDSAETDEELSLDTIKILPSSSTVTVTTRKTYYDGLGKVTRVVEGEPMHFLDRPAKEGSEELTDYTDFLVNAGIDLAKIKSAL